MPETYEAIIHGDRIVRWIEACPPQVAAGLTVRVSIIILEAVPSDQEEDTESREEPKSF